MDESENIEEYLEENKKDQIILENSRISENSKDSENSDKSEDSNDGIEKIGSELGNIVLKPKKSKAIIQFVENDIGESVLSEFSFSWLSDSFSIIFLRLFSVLVSGTFSVFSLLFIIFPSEANENFIPIFPPPELTTFGGSR